MTEEVIITPEAEVIAPEVVVEAPVAPTMEEIIETTVPEEKPNLIPESVFLGEKKARKAAERELKALKASIESGATTQEISDDIAEIAEEHNIDKDFLQKLATTIKSQTEKDLDAKYSSKLEAEKFEVAFDRAYKTAIERAPEFASIANPDIIKTLSTQPQNSKKTVSQILEETYSNALTGKRTIETTTPGGGKDPEPLDIKRAENDIEYFKEVMSDPKRKAQYNSQMLTRGF